MTSKKDETTTEAPKAKRVSKCDKTINLETGEVVFTFADGTVRKYEETDFPVAIQAHLLLHGLSQVGGDAYAGSETVAEAITAHDGRIANLRDGKWTVRTGGGGPRVTQLAEALFRAMAQTQTPQDLDACTKAVDGMEKEQIAALRKQLRPILNEIAAEKAAERAKASAGQTVDVAGLFG